MTPKQAAAEFWSINALCKNPINREPDKDTTKLKHRPKIEFESRTNALAKVQNRFDAYQWTDYSLEHLRLGKLLHD